MKRFVEKLIWRPSREGSSVEMKAVGEMTIEAEGNVSEEERAPLIHISPVKPTKLSDDDFQFMQAVPSEIALSRLSEER